MIVRKGTVGLVLGVSGQKGQNIAKSSHANFFGEARNQEMQSFIRNANDEVGVEYLDSVETDVHLVKNFF